MFLVGLLVGSAAFAVLVQHIVCQGKAAHLLASVQKTVTENRVSGYPERGHIASDPITCQ